MASFTPDLAQFSAQELRKLAFDVTEELVERELNSLCVELTRLETLSTVGARGKATVGPAGRFEIARCTPRTPAYRFDSADDNWGGF